MAENLFNKTILLNTGQQMPMLGLGTGMSYGDEIKQSVRLALEIGYRAIDTAYLYRNEIAVGEELNAWFESGRIKREEVFITTKLPMFGNRHEDVSKYMMKSLKQLNLKYVDLYLIHTPFSLKEDPMESSNPDEIKIDYDTDLVQIWKAMEEQVDARRTKAIGFCNFNSRQIDIIKENARIQPSCHQIEVHVYLQRKQMLDHCRKQNLQVIAFSPVRAPYTAEGQSLKLLDDPVVKTISEKNKKTACQVILRFLLQKGVCIIPKSAIPKEIKENSQLNFTLSSEDMSTLEELDMGKKGRIYDYLVEYKGVEDHKDYPFHADF